MYLETKKLREHDVHKMFGKRRKKTHIAERNIIRKVRHQILGQNLKATCGQKLCIIEC